MSGDIVLVVVVATALTFDFTNGFHDTSNVVATSISTGALTPRMAVALAALFNFAGAFISLEVAATVATDVVQAGAITPTVIFAGLVGAISWNLLTWYHGIPSSSSHALIGGMVGAAFAAAGAGAVIGEGVLGKVLVPAVLAPILAVGVATLALIANGNLSATSFEVPTWVIVSAATAMAAGTYTGGWRIIRTMGTRIIKMNTAQGFAAEGSGAAVILASSHFGFPLSTTQVIAGSVMGAGAGKRLSAVRWGVAGNMLAAWLLTLPAAAAVGGAVYGFTRLFGTGAVGPVLVFVAAIAFGLTLFARRLRVGQPVPSA